MSDGISAMLGYLGYGREETVAAIQPCLGKVIASVALVDDVLRLTFQDGSRLDLWDDGQSCCESRWMHTDADLPYYGGAVLQNISIESAELPPPDYADVYEAQFLHIHTSKGILDAVTHINHNGYYGGFAIRAIRHDP